MVGSEFYTDERCWITELWGNADDVSVSLARCRVEAGVTTQLHSLTVFERYLIEQGEGVMQVGAVTRRVKPGDSVTIPVGTAQRIANVGTGDLVFLVLCTPRFVPECYRNLEQDNLPPPLVES